MIVTCSECSTSFQLDEARIPTTGAQVRCSRCKHAFFLAHPSASQTESMHEIAGAAAADPAAGVPSASSDLGGLGTDQSEEDEWQFSEEVRVEGDEEGPPETASEDDSGFGLGEDFSEGLDADSLSQDVTSDHPNASHQQAPEVAGLASEDDGEGSGLELEGPDTPEPSSPSAAGETVRDESSFGSVDDFSSLMEDEEPAGTSVAAAVSAESSAVIDRPPEASPGGYAASGTTDDLGDPESWDLIGGAPASALQRGASSTQSTAGGAVEDALADLSFLPDPDSLGYTEDREPSALAALVGKFGHAIGWAATLAALVAVTGLLVGPEFSRWADAPQSSAFGSLQAETNEMHWMETARSGFVLVMRGEVENTGAEEILPSNVRLWLLDGAGERLSAAPLQVGFSLGEETLREAGEPALRGQIESAVQAFSARPIGSGESRAFEAILLEGDLPTSARRILLEVADPTAEMPVATSAAEVIPRSISVAEEPIDPVAAAPGTQPSAVRVSDLLELDD